MLLGANKNFVFEETKHLKNNFIFDESNCTICLLQCLFDRCLLQFSVSFSVDYHNPNLPLFAERIWSSWSWWVFNNFIV